MQEQKTTQFNELDFVDAVEESIDDEKPSVTESPVHPRHDIHFGTHIAIAIDESSVSMASIVHAGHYRKIKELNKHYTTQENSRPRERSAFITKLVNDFLNKHKGPFSVISLAISGRETALRSFLMPVLKKQDLKNAIEIEAKKQLPFPVDECTYDFRPISLVKSDERELYNISLLAATRRLINEKLHFFGEKKKHVEHIYHAPDIVGRLLPYVENFEDFAAYTTLNIGQQESEIAFYRGSALEFYSVISVGAAMLGKNPDSVSYAFLAESLANEIQTAVDFYTGRFSRPVTNKIFVYGDLTYRDDVFDGLKNTSGYTFERFPVDKLKFISTKDHELFKHEIPVCLPAFAAAACPAGMADVLPKESKQIHRSFRLHNFARAALLVLGLVLLSAWGLMTKAVSIKQNELVSLNKQVNEFVNSEAYRTYNLYKRQIAIDKAYLDAAKDNPTFLSLNLKELTHLTPNEVRLMNMQYRPEDQNQNLMVHGIVFSRNVPPEVILAEFIENMSRSPFYENVEISKHLKREINGGFEIDFSVKCRGRI